VISDWPIPVGAGSQLAISGGVAVFAVGHNIYVINMATGHTRYVGSTPTGLIGLELTPVGAVYAWNSRGHGYLQRITAARLRRLVGAGP
jgi:hypothetical protein